VAARSTGQDDILAWQRTLSSPERSVWVVAGATEPARIHSDATAMFGKWRPAKKGVGGPLPALPPPPEAHTWVFEWPGAILADVSVSCRLPGRTDQTAATLLVLQELLEYASWRNLREGLGIYGTGVWVDAIDPRVSLLTVRATTTEERAGPALESMRGVIWLAAAGAPDSAVAWSRKMAEARLVRELASGVGTHRLLVTAAGEGRTVDGVRRLRDEVAKVDAASLSAILSDCAGHEAATAVGRSLPDVSGERVRWQERAEALVDSLR
jgi:predicted Zn-dependent peptidase